MHTLVNGYKNLLSIAVETEISWEGIEELKDRIANPDAYASAGPAATGAAETSAGGAAETKAAEKEPEPAEESDDDMGFGLFD